MIEYLKFDKGNLQGNTQDPVASSSPSAGSIAVVLYGIVSFPPSLFLCLSNFFKRVLSVYCVF